MTERHGTNPVRWWTLDDFCVPPADEIPPDTWRGWEAHYANDTERGKRTTRGIGRVFKSAQPWLPLLTEQCASEWSERLGYAVEQDHTMHGAGLHVTRGGGHLGCHLDYSRHPVIPNRRRALNFILFLHDYWTQDYGGELYLANPLGEPVATFIPRPGRLIAFECGDLSYHGVKPTIPNAPDRVSVAVYLLAEATERDTRQRAMFLPNREGMK